MAAQLAEIGHFDIAGTKLESLSHFYGNLFGWEVDPRGPGYAQVSTPGLKGALIEAPEASLTIGVIVGDLEAALEKSQALGGTVTMPAIDNGWVHKAQISDPAGNVLTLIQR
jgi:predicted enzyme related to lactoylglutathione lyase